MAFLCEMCIQLHLEDYTGIVQKQLNSYPWRPHEQDMASKLPNQAQRLLKPSTSKS